MVQYPSVADNNPAPIIHSLSGDTITYFGYAPIGTPTNALPGLM